MKRPRLVLFWLILLTPLIYWITMPAGSDRKPLELDSKVSESTPDGDEVAQLDEVHLPNHRTAKITPTPEEPIQDSKNVPETWPDDQLYFYITLQVVDGKGALMRHHDLQFGYGLKDDREHTATTNTIPFQAKTDGEGRLTETVPYASNGLRYISFWLHDPKTYANGFVDPVEIAHESNMDLGRVALLTARERFPAPLVAGQVLSEDKTVIEGVHGQLNFSAFSEDEKDAPTWPGFLGVQFVFENSGRFSAYGPPGIELGDLSLSADGFQSEELIAISIPSLSLQVELARQQHWSGQLLVPEHGPPVSEYGVWISEPGRGGGIGAGQDGKFYAGGTSRAESLKVSHPLMGNFVYLREFIVPPNEKEGLGVIDIRELVRVVKVRLVDQNGQPHVKEEIYIQSEGLSSIGSKYRTDADGYLLTVFPVETETINIRRIETQPVEVNLNTLGSTLEL